MLATATNPSIYVHPPVACSAVASEGPLGMIGTPMRFARNTEVYGEDEPPISLSGDFRCGADLQNVG